MLSKLPLRPLLFGSVLVAMTFGGCGRSAPENLPATIVVKSSSGEPMNMVKVKFIPQTEGLDGNYIATGITDDAGSCMPTIPGNPNIAGVPAGKHKVIISEAPVSNEARTAQDRNDQALANKEMKSRKYRPIPRKYSRILSTPIEVDINEDNLEIEFVLE